MTILFAPPVFAPSSFYKRDDAGIRRDPALRRLLAADGHRTDDDQVVGWLKGEITVWTPETRSATTYHRNPDASIPLMAGERVV